MLNELLRLQDSKYAIFQNNLIPNVSKEKILGVRIPEIRKLAKQYKNTDIVKQFLSSLPHYYYDENMLHGILISEIEDFDDCICEINRFLPYVDNWAVCDTMSPKIFKNNKNKLIKNIMIWINSPELYTCRFGIKMLMTYFLDDEFKYEYLEEVSRIKTDEYYLKMMISWFFATALSKKWNETIEIITERKLDKWVHNKTIQKACESYRITIDQKDYLRKLKI